MTDTSKATPRPWRYKHTPGIPSHGVYGPPHVDGGDYAPLAKLSEQSDAALIVKAVNAFDAMRDALRQIAEDADCHEDVIDGSHVCGPEIARAALAAAEGKEEAT